MEITEFLGLIGLDLKTVLVISTGIFLIMSKLKTEIPAIKGRVTTLLSLGIAVGVSFLVYSNGTINWKAIITTAVVSWLLPASAGEMLKKVGGGTPTSAFRKKKGML